MNIRSLCGYAYYVRKHRCSTGKLDLLEATPVIRFELGSALKAYPYCLAVLVLPLAGLVSVENNASPHNKQIHIWSAAISIIDP